MNVAFRFILGALFAFLAAPAVAIDPGVAQGAVQAGETAIKLTHAYAYYDRPKELRVVLADREVRGNVLPVLPFLHVAELARASKLLGLLIQIDPNNRKQAVVTVLHPSVLSRTPRVVHNLVIAHNRVSGEIDSGPPDASGVQYRTKFSAPLFESARGAQGTVPGGSVKQ